MTPEFVAALHPDDPAARAIAFGLVVSDLAAARGWLPAPARPDTDIGQFLDILDCQNPLLQVGPVLASYDSGIVDRRAVDEFAAWVRAQRLEREPPLVAFELAMLALGAELPGVVLRSLREADLAADSTTFETPDGGGYATTFLATYHPGWRGRALIGASTATAQRLGALASALRSDTLSPTGDVVRMVEQETHPALPTIDLLLIYNPPTWFGNPADVRRRVPARHAILA